MVTPHRVRKCAFFLFEVEGLGLNLKSGDTSQRFDNQRRDSPQNSVRGRHYCDSPLNPKHILHAKLCEGSQFLRFNPQPSIKNNKTP